MNNILASFMFFTRLPFWRIRQVPAECFKHVVNYWSFAGWLTGGIMAGIYCVTSFIFPPEVAALLALAGRLLVTGALHEDGLADFFDGFGGGTERTRILAIMKDSHIGSYGVIGLIVYFMLMVTLIASLPRPIAWGALLSFDAWNKFIASNLVNLLPYARKEEESKAHVVYDRMKPVEFVVALIAGTVGMFLCLPASLALSGLFSIPVFLFLVRLMRTKIQGYTGDCCGATFLLCELSSYIGLYFILHLIRLL